MLLVFAAMVICIVLLFLTEKSLSITLLGIFKFNFGYYNNAVSLSNNITVSPTVSTSRIINSEEFITKTIKVESIQTENRIRIVIDVPTTEAEVCKG